MRTKKNTEIKTWQGENGNWFFSFPFRHMLERMWEPIIATILWFLCIYLEYKIRGSFYLFFPLFLLLFIYNVIWFKRPEKANRKVIETMIHKLMDPLVEEDINAIGMKCANRVVYYEKDASDGTIKGIYLLALLDNGIVWKYPVLTLRGENGAKYFECNREHSVFNNQLSVITKSKFWTRLSHRLNLSDKTKLKILIASIFFLGAIPFLLIGLGTISFILWPKYIWAVILIFFAIIALLIYLHFRIKKSLPKREKKESRLSERELKATTMPVMDWLTRLVKPFLTISATYFVAFFFSFGLVYGILDALSGLGLIHIKPETIAFITISLGSIICSAFHPILKRALHLSPLRSWIVYDYMAIRKYLSLFLLHPSNFTFILYSAYFVFLTISGFLQIQSNSFLISASFDTAVLRAFLVYIAFTNMGIKAKDADLNVSELYQWVRYYLFGQDELDNATSIS